MIANVGGLDRVLRLMFATGMGYLGLAVYSGTMLGIGLDAIAVLALLTAVFGICPLYSLLGIRTNPSNRSQDNV
ncbi:DUF2892 domain-containing protein [Synechococcus sp. PCC 7336]|uniref:YgaP family membrane protein n=1 Tax=Synechococcus sp. PCC 7336 TaxID=195250 RepID=UPI00034DBB8E|nr:DUF2892 domain-containing protein [Synechococcus sp. PCC 7336]